MNNTPLDAPLALPYQQETSTAPDQTKRQKLMQFFLGLGLGPVSEFILAGFANTLTMGNYSSSGLLFNVAFGAVPLLAGIILTFRKSHRFLGLGILAGILLVTIAGVVIVVVFSLLISNYCSHQEPAACG